MKPLLLILTLTIFTALAATNITVCFSADLIGNTRGDLTITTQDGIIQTPFIWLNDLAKDFQITSLTRKYTLKNSDWHNNGRYPMNVFRLITNDHTRATQLIDELSKNQFVMYAEEESINHITGYYPNDPEILQQWALPKISAFEAWELETGSPDITIGIVDSGIKWNHEDFYGNIHLNAAEVVGVTINWDSGTFSGTDGIDNDGNGFIDDVMGWDFWSTYTGGTSNNPFQNYSGQIHGTHVSGIAAAKGDNGTGVAGVAYNSKVLNTKHSPFNVDVTSIWDAYSGIYYLVELGVRIINCSWGGGGGENEANDTIAFALAHDVLVVAAAGNSGVNLDNRPFFPASVPGVFAVAATNQHDVRAISASGASSNFGSNVDLAAPGIDIHSASYTEDGEDFYEELGGTSMAAPMVAGVAALVLSRNPDLTLDQLKHILKFSSDPIDHLNPQHAGMLGKGRLNAYNAVYIAQPPEFDLNVSLTSGPSSIIQHTPNNFYVNVRNFGANIANNYTLYLKSTDNETPLAVIEGVDLMPLTEFLYEIDWTPPIYGNYEIYGEIVWELDSNQLNNASPTLPITVLPSGLNIVQVGDPNTNFITGDTFVNYHFNHSMIQSIYYEEELTPGIIYQLTLDFVSATADYTQIPRGIVVNVYMATTDTEFFVDEDDLIPFDNFRHVFSDQLDVNTLGEYDVHLTLDEPYLYQGGNLAILVIKTHNNYYGPHAFRATETSEPHRTISFIGDMYPPQTNPYSEGWFTVAAYTNIRFHIYTATYLPPRNLTAIANDVPNIVLNWLQPMQDDVIRYNIYRNFELINTTQNLFYIDDNFIFDVEYSYYVTAVYQDANAESIPSNFAYIIVTDPTNDDLIELTKFENKLIGNFPNPFNPTTNIRFSTKNNAQVNIQVFNIKGQLINTIIDEMVEKGEHNVVFEGFDQNGKKLASGVYFYRLKIDEQQYVKRMILMK